MDSDANFILPLTPSCTPCECGGELITWKTCKFLWVPLANVDCFSPPDSALLTSWYWWPWALKAVASNRAHFPSYLSSFYLMTIIMRKMTKINLKVTVKHQNISPLLSLLYSFDYIFTLWLSWHGWQVVWLQTSFMLLYTQIYQSSELVVLFQGSSVWVSYVLSIPAIQYYGTWFHLHMFFFVRGLHTGIPMHLCVFHSRDTHSLRSFVYLVDASFCFMWEVSSGSSWRVWGCGFWSCLGDVHLSMRAPYLRCLTGV